MDTTNKFLRSDPKTDSINNINKSVKSFLAVINFENFRPFTLLSSQISSNNQTKTASSLAREIFSLKSKSDFTIEKIENCLKKSKTISLTSEDNWKNKKPYAALLNTLLDPQHGAFLNSNSLQYVLSYFLMANVQILQYINLKENIDTTCNPSGSQKKFIDQNSLYDKNHIMLSEKLENLITTNSKKIDNVLLVKNVEFQIFHSFLQLESALNLLNLKATRENELSFLSLNFFCKASPPKGGGLKRLNFY